LPALDALRGVAAFAVLLYHLQDSGVFHVAPRGYLAVDFFFLLSGFVVAKAYEDKLLKGWSTREFFQVRLRRIYPLHVIGSLVGMSAHLVVAALNGDWGHAVTTLAVTAAALAFVPLTRADPKSSVFPLIPAAWSLFWELAINIVFALTVRRLSNRVLQLTIAAAGIGFLGVCLWTASANIGSTAGSFPYGVFRSVFPSRSAS
jgi:peptidoglycan/LPS O-acetylase OafA/YrhL